MSVVGGFGDFGGVVVADFGGQSRHQHQRVADVAVNLLAVDLDGFDAVVHEADAGVGAWWGYKSNSSSVRHR